MPIFNVQYSRPTDNRIAVSEWIEHISTIEASTPKEAIEKFNKTHQHIGTWMILDCWIDKNNVSLNPGPYNPNYEEDI